MLAVTLEDPNFDDPLIAIKVGERELGAAPPGWTRVRVRAASLNRHDVWSMRGVGVDAASLPVVLGTDGAGVDDQGNEVIIYPVIADPASGGGDETLDPGIRLLSEGVDGTFAEAVNVPRRNLIPKPASMSWETAASLGTAWLTAYRMLYTAASVPAGSTVLVQGAGGGLATALTVLARAGGMRVWVTSRSEEKGDRAVTQLGADQAFASGARLPERVDAVMESVGEATWAHSLRAVRRGGRIVVAGTTAGADPKAELSRVFLNQISVIGTTMGTLDELRRLVRLCETAGIEAVVDSTFPLSDARSGIERMVAGEVFGKVVFEVST